MSQNFSALVSGTTTFGDLYGIINDNQDALRSAFAGTSFPPNPTDPQFCFRTDQDRLYLYRVDSWEDITDFMPDFVALEAEMENARGLAATLKAFLDVAHNSDGSLKSDAPAGTWWTEETDLDGYASSSTFTITGDKTHIYTARRAIKLTQLGVDTYGYVVESSESGGDTTVTVDITVTSDLTDVSYGQEVLNTPYVTGGNLRNIEIFTAGGTYTKPSWLKFAIVEGAGAGGSGAGGTTGSNASVGGGGGAGGYFKKKIVAASIGATETVTIGSGGDSVTGDNDGNNGGTTSFGSHCSATGGAGGSSTINTTETRSRDGGSGGVGSDGDLNAKGQPGNNSSQTSSKILSVGIGGSSFFSGGGNVSSSAGTNNGESGLYGSGGAGGSVQDGTAATSGDGGDGIVIVYEYE